MIGAVCGDIIGSYYEFRATKDMHFNLFPDGAAFTDDTVLTAAVCDAILDNPGDVTALQELRGRAQEYAAWYKRYYARYPHAGFGTMFRAWAGEKTFRRQNSYANGGAMRVVPIAYAYSDLEQVMLQTRLSCIYTHHHPEAIKAAQAVACAVFLALHGETKEKIKSHIEKNFGYAFSFKLADIRESFDFSSRADDSVPPAIAAFLESSDYEDAVRLAVSLGGDSDTMACIAGGIAEAYYRHIPDFILDRALGYLDQGLKKTVLEFCRQYAAAAWNCENGCENK